MSVVKDCGTLAVVYETRDEICDRFLNAERVKRTEIYRKILAKYGESCISKMEVCEWFQEFKNGLQGVQDSRRPWQAHRVMTPEIIAALDLIQKIAALQLVI